MNDIFTEKLISLRELALLAFALFLLAAAPAKNYVQESGQQLWIAGLLKSCR